MPSDPALKRVRTRHFQRAKEQGIKITGLTSYDCLSAGIFDEAGIDFLLVGDSAGNTVFGYDTTMPVTVDELIPLTRAVVRAVKRALVIADMPFGSYENGPDEALRHRHAVHEGDRLPRGEVRGRRAQRRSRSSGSSAPASR